MIIQKAYKIIPQLFLMLYSKLIKVGYHPMCWRNGLGAILKKSSNGARDYSKPKSYRIIALLNCLSKIIEKLIATRLSYYDATTNIMNFEQMSGRKNLSVIDAVMNLVHDVEIINKHNRVLTCAFLDVKGALDHVSIRQMLTVLKKLKLFNVIII